MKIFQYIDNKRKEILRKRIIKDLILIAKKNVLDNGCGKNGSWNYKETPTLQVTPIDKIYGQDSHKLEFERNSFDVVVFSGVINYLENSVKALKECYRVLKPKGLLLISSTNPNSLFKLFKGFKTETILFTLSGLKKLCQHVGFKIKFEKLMDFELVPNKRKMIIYMVCKK